MEIKSLYNAARRSAVATTLSVLLAAGAAVGQETNTEETIQLSLDEKHGNWHARCAVNNGVEECGISQDIVDSKQGFRVARIQIFSIPSHDVVVAGAIVLTPLGTNVEQGIELRVDSSQARRYGFKFCLADGCVAKLGFFKSEVDEMARGRNLRMTVFNLEDLDTPLSYDISLIGFTAAFRAISSR